MCLCLISGNDILESCFNFGVLDITEGNHLSKSSSYWPNFAVEKSNNKLVLKHYLFRVRVHGAGKEAGYVLWNACERLL